MTQHDAARTRAGTGSTGSTSSMGSTGSTRSTGPRGIAARVALAVLVAAGTLAGCAAPATTVTTATTATLPAPSGGDFSTPVFAGTVVLVHGAWGGGWDWRPVDRMLTARGYDVYRVTLTGLGERVHLVGPAVDLSTHVADVVNTILFEDLRNVILLGHSYGGMVITGVADSIPERLEAVVYLDAMVPRSGESVMNLVPRVALGRDGELPEVIVPSWVDPAAPFPRDVPHPAATLTQPLALRNAPAAGVRAAYILTRETGPEPDGFQWAADRAAALGWEVHVLEADHNAQRSARGELVGLIEAIARDTADPPPATGSAGPPR